MPDRNTNDIIERLEAEANGLDKTSDWELHALLAEAVRELKYERSYKNGYLGLLIVTWTLLCYSAVMNMRLGGFW